MLGTVRTSLALLICFPPQPYRRTLTTSAIFEMIDPSVGLGFGGFGTGVKCIELLLFIVKTTQEAHQLKDECIKVGTAATTLKSVLDGNKAALKDAKTESLLERTLLEVADFAIACRNKNILRRSWEIIWIKRLPALLKEMEMWVTFLNTEVSVCTISTLKKRSLTEK